jgi:RimJ/RimL family protein N-acetyltransferase
MAVDTQAASGALVLKTARLRLRRFRNEDANAVFAIIGDRIAMRFYPKMFGREDAEQWITRNQRRYREDGYGLFAVMLRESEEVIGDCGIIKQNVEGETAMEVGYHFRRDQWGCGYATEAARACMDLAFDAFGADKVSSLIRPENIPSRRVAERNGMKLDREIVHYGLPHLVYAMRRDEFEFTQGLKSQPRRELERHG